MYVNIVKFDRNLTVVAIFFIPILIIGKSKQSLHFFVIITSSMIFGILPYFETLTSQKSEQGWQNTRPWSFDSNWHSHNFHLTFVSVPTENRIGDGSGAFAVAMWLHWGFLQLDWEACYFQ